MLKAAATIGALAFFSLTLSFFPPQRFFFSVLGAFDFFPLSLSHFDSSSHSAITTQFLSPSCCFLSPSTFPSDKNQVFFLFFRPQQAPIPIFFSIYSVCFDAPLVMSHQFWKPPLSGTSLCTNFQFLSMPFPPIHNHKVQSVRADAF